MDVFLYLFKVGLFFIGWILIIYAIDNFVKRRIK